MDKNDFYKFGPTTVVLKTKNGCLACKESSMPHFPWKLLRHDIFLVKRLCLKMTKSMLDSLQLDKDGYLVAIDMKRSKISFDSTLTIFQWGQQTFKISRNKKIMKNDFQNYLQAENGKNMPG